MGNCSSLSIKSDISNKGTKPAPESQKVEQKIQEEVQAVEVSEAKPVEKSVVGPNVNLD